MLRLFAGLFSGVVIVAAAHGAMPAAAGASEWTLESATRRVLESAPERRAADAAVARREAELRAAGSWPNPHIELRADDKLGLDDGRGGIDLTRLGISQPLPLRRLSRQRTAAQAALRSAEAARRMQRLELERETAHVYHALQHAAARIKLAQDRRAATTGYLPNGAGARTRRDPLVRYLTPLEQRRLAVLREEAQQAVLAAQREYENALTRFRAWLGLTPDAAVEVAPLASPEAPPALAALERGLEAHPLLVAAQQDIEAARAGIAVAESQRFADPELGVFRERDYLNNARRVVTAVELTVQIPLWNMNRGPVDRAKADLLRAEADLAVARRDTLSRLRQRHIELTRLLEQTERMRTGLLEPARELLDLARRGFVSGESNVLALVDAYNTYYEAQTRYLDTLKDAALVAAELRFVAGRSVLGAEVTP